MFKKFMSKALLSMVLDKKARDKLSPSKDPEPADVWDQGEQAAPPPSDPEMTREETETLIKQSLDFAERKLSQSGPMTAGRQSLISQAMAVHKSKTGLFNDLNQEQREKLYVVAMKSFKLDPGPKGGKGGGR